jgi:hypothetical protein
MTPVERGAYEANALKSRMLRLIAINAYAAYSNSIMAAHAPRGREIFDRVRQPIVGDLVVETSTIWKWARNEDEAPMPDGCPFLGILMKIAYEPYPRVEGDLEPEPDAREIVHYIKPLDGHRDEVRWTNASFIKVFQGLGEAR